MGADGVNGNSILCKGFAFNGEAGDSGGEAESMRDRTDGNN